MTSIFRLRAALHGAPLLLLAAPLAAQAPLTLGEALEAARRRVAVATGTALLVARGDAEARVARAALLPVVGVRATAVRQVINPAAFGLPGLPARATDPFGTVDARAAVRVPLLDLAARDRWRAARTRVEALRADGDRDALAAAVEAATAYLDVAQAEALREARRADTLLAARFVALAEERLAAGLVPAIERTRAAGRLADARAAAIAADGDVGLARLALERAVDDAALAARPLALPLERQAARATLPDETEAVRRALATRDELRALDTRLAAHATELRARGRDALPSAALVADAGSIGRTGDAMVGTWRVGVEVTSTVLDGLARPARRDALAAERDGLRIEREETARRIALDVRAARLALVTAAAHESAARERLRIAEAEVGQATSRVEAGLDDNADLVVALAGLERARTVYVAALAARAAARLALDAATGVIEAEGPP